jgi:hypothetical protein
MVTGRLRKGRFPAFSSSLLSESYRHEPDDPQVTPARALRSSGPIRSPQDRRSWQAPGHGRTRAHPSARVASRHTLKPPSWSATPTGGIGRSGARRAGPPLGELVRDSLRCGALLSCVGFGWYEERAMGQRKGKGVRGQWWWVMPMGGCSRVVLGASVQLDGSEEQSRRSGCEAEICQ